MAELVTSESRRYLHGIQSTIISDDDAGVVLNIIPSNNQLALIDAMEVDGTLTVYGDAYVISSKNDDSLAPANHNETVGRDVYAAHPASAVSVVPVGSVIATDMQSAIAALDAGKVASNPSLTPSTKTKITYDSKGLVISGSNATASDITYVPYRSVCELDVQGAINRVEDHAVAAQTAAAKAQAAANAASTAAAYADRLARSCHNLIKNGNSEDPNPTGWEAVGVSTGGAYTGNKCRVITSSGSFSSGVITPRIQCAPGDQFVFEAQAGGDHYTSLTTIAIEFYDAAGNWVTSGNATPVTGVGWQRHTISMTAPANAAFVDFIIGSSGPAGTVSRFDCLYATRKISAGMLEGDAIQSTTSDFSVTSTTASTSTTTGAVVVAGGVASGDFFTGKYRSSDGSAGLTATRTFYAASSWRGATNVLHTVTINDGIITSWTQA